VREQNLCLQDKVDANARRCLRTKAAVFSNSPKLARAKRNFDQVATWAGV
jgi:hypothetical protein